MDDEAQIMCYIGRKSCGCVVAATVDEPQYREDVAKDIADWLRSGLTIERVTVEYARQNLNFSCPHKQQPAST